ncbi:sigma-70 family RNA polymerase sigma factor [Nocardiopsis kunsanensis]|uniref:Uncharacterized protein n=1 Tax=Nocardiopsis kunsanensis TaxID=141693 RepID=A0A919CKN6_9ACTN|nr:sigma-70 family RNA polymerase sigma factor [Nocardiopsis kunsanensis]GHD33748.1 hypothetical protein GCM10007147_38710 [Nocardiopsis kunsanensis]
MQNTTTAPRTQNRNLVPQPRKPVERREAENLLEALSEVKSDSSTACELRTRIEQIVRPVVAKEASRFRNRGVDSEELFQVACLGLMKAIRGYDPTRGVRFVSYLLPVVSGEIKRHFRDHEWSVNVPRHWREKRSELNKFVMEFTQNHAREPRRDEIAEHFGLSEAQTSEFLNAAASYSAISLETPWGTAEEGTAGTLAGTISQLDKDLESVVDRQTLRAAINRLPQRERHAIALSFFGELPQTVIAEHLGCSQMQVSRILSSAVSQLRKEFFVRE